MNKIIMVLLLLITISSGFVLNCSKDDGMSSKDKLDTTTHSYDGIYYDEGLFADMKWRFISYSEEESGIKVTGSWIINYSNTSSIRYRVVVSKFTFEDKEEFQIASDIQFNFVNVEIGAGESIQRQGNFEFSVASVTVANSITDMYSWASVTEANLE